ncbi:MAG: glycosyltransferase family 4 protein [Bacteroidales bacterium]|nr:glycosyltransferase family 4 protein [Bacteroidales bacterium]
MKILIINHYAGSPKMGMAYRPYYLAKEWMKKGHEVMILCANFSHLRKENPRIENDFEITYEDGVKYCWVKTPAYKGNGVKRIINMFTFIFKLRFNIKKILSIISPDVVISSSTYPLDNYIAGRISKKTKAQHIFEVHDLWPLSPMELGKMSKYHPFIIIMQVAENFAYKYADKVVSMLPATKEHMKEHGLDLKKWYHIPNGIVTEDWKNPKEIPDFHSEILSNLKKEGKKIVGYAGGHAISNSLDTLIEAAKLLKDNSEIVFVLVGDGQEKKNLTELAKGFKNIIFLNSISKQSIPDLLPFFNVAVIGAVDSSLYRFGVSPNKLFDYMVAKIPVIQYINSGNDIVLDANAGISIESGNPKAIADAVQKLLNMPEKDLKQMGENGKEYVLKNHDYKVLAEKFINIIEKE